MRKGFFGLVGLLVVAATVGLLARRAPAVLTADMRPLAKPSSEQTLSAPLIQIGDLSYLGSFHVPTTVPGAVDGRGFDWGGAALAFNAAHQSLLIVGHAWDQRTAEISIPSIGGTATVLQGLTDVTGGRLASINVGDSGTKMIGGHLLDGGNLIISAFSYYDGAGTQQVSHFTRTGASLTGGTVTGPVRVGPLGAGWYSGYMAPIPSAWQTALGGTALTGNCCLSIISRTSFGPSVSSFTPSAITGTATLLVGYDSAHQTLGSSPTLMEASNGVNFGSRDTRSTFTRSGSVRGGTVSASVTWTRSGSASITSVIVVKDCR